MELDNEEIDRFDEVVRDELQVLYDHHHQSASAHHDDLCSKDVSFNNDSNDSSSSRSEIAIRRILFEVTSLIATTTSGQSHENEDAGGSTQQQKWTFPHAFKVISVIRKLVKDFEEFAELVYKWLLLDVLSKLPEKYAALAQKHRSFWTNLLQLALSILSSVLVPQRDQGEDRMVTHHHQSASSSTTSMLENMTLEALSICINEDVFSAKELILAGASSLLHLNSEACAEFVLSNILLVPLDDLEMVVGHVLESVLTVDVATLVLRRISQQMIFPHCGASDEDQDMHDGSKSRTDDDRELTSRKVLMKVLELTGSLQILADGYIVIVREDLLLQPCASTGLNPSDMACVILLSRGIQLSSLSEQCEKQIKQMVSDGIRKGYFPFQRVRDMMRYLQESPPLKLELSEASVSFAVFAVQTICHQITNEKNSEFFVSDDVTGAISSFIKECFHELDESPFGRQLLSNLLRIRDEVTVECNRIDKSNVDRNSKALNRIQAILLEAAEQFQFCLETMHRYSKTSLENQHRTSLITTQVDVELLVVTNERLMLQSPTRRKPLVGLVQSLLFQITRSNDSVRDFRITKGLILMREMFKNSSSSSSMNDGDRRSLFQLVQRRLFLANRRAVSPLHGRLGLGIFLEYGRPGYSDENIGSGLTMLLGNTGLLQRLDDYRPRPLSRKKDNGCTIAFREIHPFFLETVSQNQLRPLVFCIESYIATLRSTETWTDVVEWIFQLLYHYLRRKRLAAKAKPNNATEWDPSELLLAQVEISSTDKLSKLVLDHHVDLREFLKHFLHFEVDTTSSDEKASTIIQSLLQALPKQGESVLQDTVEGLLRLAMCLCASGAAMAAVSVNLSDHVLDGNKLRCIRYLQYHVLKLDCLRRKVKALRFLMVTVKTGMPYNRKVASYNLRRFSNQLDQGIKELDTISSKFSRTGDRFPPIILSVCATDLEDSKVLSEADIQDPNYLSLVAVRYQLLECWLISKSSSSEFNCISDAALEAFVEYLGCLPAVVTKFVQQEDVQDTLKVRQLVSRSLEMLEWRLSAKRLNQASTTREHKPRPKHQQGQKYNDWQSSLFDTLRIQLDLCEDLLFASQILACMSALAMEDKERCAVVLDDCWQVLRKDYGDDTIEDEVTQRNLPVVFLQLAEQTTTKTSPSKGLVRFALKRVPIVYRDHRATLNVMLQMFALGSLEVEDSLMEAFVNDLEESQGSKSKESSDPTSPRSAKLAGLDSASFGFFLEAMLYRLVSLLHESIQEDNLKRFERLLQLYDPAESAVDYGSLTTVQDCCLAALRATRDHVADFLQPTVKELILDAVRYSLFKAILALCDRILGDEMEVDNNEPATDTETVLKREEEAKVVRDLLAGLEETKLVMGDFAANCDIILPTLETESNRLVKKIRRQADQLNKKTRNRKRKLSSHCFVYSASKPQGAGEDEANDQLDSSSETESFGATWGGDNTDKCMLDLEE